MILIEAMSPFLLRSHFTSFHDSDERTASTKEAWEQTLLAEATFTQRGEASAVCDTQGGANPSWPACSVHPEQAVLADVYPRENTQGLLPRSRILLVTLTWHEFVSHTPYPALGLRYSAVRSVGKISRVASECMGTTVCVMSVLQSLMC